MYRARDTRLDRTVAIKILSDHLSSNAELKQRFEREAKAISALQHPNICVLHDVGSENGTDFLVMEYLEGETLAERCMKGALPTEQVLRYAIQIADALERAHRQGITHRDLKPGNVMITKSGAKLLDFGLAKPRAAAAGTGSALEGMTLSKPLTAHGMILGTIQYMAPEQLEGKEADARSDIFALGSLIYEMATGKATFSGKTQASVIAAILASEPPPISSIASMSPNALDRLVRICIAKDPEDRWQTAHDVKLQLQAVAEGGSEPGVPISGLQHRRSMERAAWALALVAVIVGALTAIRIRPIEFQPTGRLLVAPPESVGLGFGAVSPDGQRMAFLGTSNGRFQIWTRRLDALTTQPLAGTEGIRPFGASDSGAVFWSPDSKSIGYFAQGALKVIEADGGPPQTLCDAPGQGSGTWSSDGTILFGLDESPGREGIYRIPAAGGTAERLKLVDEEGKELHAGWPSAMPDGKHFLLVTHAHGTDTYQLRTALLGSSTTRLIMPTESRAQYALPGYLLYVRKGTLFAQPFDANKLLITGKPSPLAEGVGYSPATSDASFSTSQNGVLLYQPEWQRQRQFVRVNRSGHELETLGEPMNSDFPVISPSGRQVLFTVNDAQASTSDIWVHDIVRKSTMRVTSGSPGAGGGSAFIGIWSPDGRHIVFSADWKGVPYLYQQELGAPAATELTPGTGKVQVANDWSSDGKFILYMVRDPANDWDLWALPLQGDKQPIPIAITRFFEGEGAFSPDGRWIAYVSDDSGRHEVYIQPFQRAGERKRVSSGGGGGPRWRRDGKELFYTDGNQMMSVAVKPGADIELSSPKALFAMPELVNDWWTGGGGASSDGQSFILSRTIGPDKARYPVVMINWPAELKK
ncbi:MAG: serine/threonine protein kinase [Acidobacteriaceae bacterium]|nr:serine/threonine protein kinase [Acidobacteriaceae bacterium]